jgi:nicotinamide-nucleotide amidase
VNAEIITVGTELLLGQIIDTNSAYISRRLAEAGIGVYYRTTVGDNAGRFVQALRAAAGRADVIIITGGLGPTVDDITRDAVSEFTGRRIIPNEEVLATLREFFRRRGLDEMPESNKVQAGIPEGAEIIKNDRGTAPGFILEHGGKIIACMPGVPHEMTNMLETAVIPFILKKQSGHSQIIKYITLRTSGISEAAINDRIKDIFQSGKNPTIGTLAHLTDIEIRITAGAATVQEADGLIANMKKQITDLIGEFIYGENDDTLEGKIAEILKNKKLTISTAESCTSGMIAALLTNIPGSSAYYAGGINAYSNKVKTGILGVDPEIIEKYGAVSEECARDMAEKCAEKFGTDAAVSVSGIAGPDGGTAEKPVGLVFVAIKFLDSVCVFRYVFPWGRDMVRKRAAATALFELLKILKKA